MLLFNVKSSIDQNNFLLNQNCDNQLTANKRLSSKKKIPLEFDKRIHEVFIIISPELNRT